MGPRVILVDDSATILALVAAALRRDGYELATAENGEDALELIREHRPEVVIVDALLPGMSGYDVCSALRQDAGGPSPHVIMLTAGVRETDRDRAHEVGVDEFMTKPFSPLALRDRVRELLGE
ncbi:MAG: response regulator [Gaiellaceae bacterium]